MTKEVCKAEFVDTLVPLFPDVTKDHLAEIFLQASIECASSHEQFKCLRFERTVFVLPKANAFYVTLKQKDLNHINSTLKTLQLNKQLRKILGIFSKIGFVQKHGSVNKCNPMIRIDLGSRPAFEVKAKVSRFVSSENCLDANQEAQKKINEEMKYREDYNDDLNTPKIEYHGYYIGRRKGEECLKHLEVSELCDRDLHELIHSKCKKIGEYYSFSESDKYNILYQILSILHLLHDDGIVYGDMKPENIYIRRDEPKQFIAKLGDFGDLAERHKLHGTNGTHNYWSPEHIRYEFTKHPNDQTKIGFATDIWCFGWVLVHLFQLKKPIWYQPLLDFLNNSDWGTYIRYLHAMSTYDKIPCPATGSLQEQLLWHCWRLDPQERWKTDDLMHLLETQSGVTP